MSGLAEGIGMLFRGIEKPRIEKPVEERRRPVTAAKRRTLKGEMLERSPRVGRKTLLGQ